MTDINIRVVGSANMKAMTAPFAAFEAQVAAANEQLARMVTLQNGLDPKGYQRMSKAAAQNSATFRNAAASTGMFEVQQLRVNKATDDFVSKLQKQKVSFGDMLRQHKLMTAAYRDQLRLQNMVAKTSTFGTTHGKMTVDTVTPNVVTQTRGLQKFNNVMGYTNQLLKSGATQMINWGKNTQWAGRQLSMGFTMPIAALGVAAGVMAYQMDHAFTQVAKVYNTTAQSGIAQQRELDKVRVDGMKTAMIAAEQYGQAGKDTIGVQAQLAATGLKGQELQKSTIEVMRIARLGELDYNDAVKTTISLQSVFGLHNKKLADSFNYINDVENQTSLETKDFAKAIPIAAAPVKAFGGDLQELGTLLVAMKQNGIEATQGANAIKAAMQRLGRPSAQVQSEWKALTGTDITKIFDQSKGLIDLFTRIGDATANLAPKDQIKAFAGLFGTYQVTRMMAMVHGMEDLKNGVGQVSVAAKLAGQDTAQWAKVAQTEIDRYKNSLSGKWDRAIQDMKLQLSTLGEPFVAVATDIITHLSDVIKWFNKLPDAGKKLIALPILLTALAGPLLMLTGLVANLGGNGFKVLAAGLSLVVPKFELLTTTQKAAALAAEQQKVATLEQANATQTLTKYLELQTAAQALANKETRAARINAYMGTNGGGAFAHWNAVAAVQREDMAAQGAMGTLSNASGAGAANMKKFSTFARLSAVSLGLSTAAMIGMTVSSDKTVQNMMQWVMIAGLLGPLLLPVLVKAGAYVGTIVTETMAVRAGMAAVDAEIGVLEASMAVLGAETAVAFAPVTAVVATLAAIGGAFYLIHKHQEEVDKKQQEIYNKSVASNKALTNTAANFASNLGKAAKNYNTIIKGGQPGFTSAGGQFIGGKAYQAYKYYSQDSQGKKDATALQGTLDDTGVSMKKYQQLFLDYQQKLGYSAKGAMQTLQGMLIAIGKSGAEAQQIASEVYNTMGDISKINWTKPLANAKSILDTELASGLAKASTGDHVMPSIGGRGGVATPPHTDWKAVLADNMNGLKAVQTQITEYAGMFTQAWNSASNPKQAANVARQFTDAMLTEYTKAFQKLMQNPIMAQLFGQKGIGNASQLASAFDTGALSYTDVASAMNKVGPTNKNYMDPQQFQSMMMFAQAYEKAMGGAAAKAGALGDNVHTADELMAALVATGKNLTFKQAVAQVNDIITGVQRSMQILEILKATNKGGVNDPQIDIVKAQLAQNRAAAMGQINAMNMARGYQTGSTYAKALYNFMNQVSVKTGEAAKHAKDLSNYVNGLPTQMSITLSAKEAITVVHDAMSATEDDMVASAQSAFNNRWDSSMASEQAMWDNRAKNLQASQAAASQALQNRQAKQSDALQRQQQAAADALDKKFQKRQDAINKMYDDRIAHVNKEIKAEQDADAQRQKMYEAEKKRMQDLADMANKNIDFNSAINSGQFDEAAKIKNDMEAQSAANTMDAIEARRSARVQKVVDRLQKKVDNLGKMRDKELKALQNTEDAQKKHLERIQQAQTAALQKAQQAQTAAQQKAQQSASDALQKRSDADMAAMQKTRDYEEAMLNQRLDLFKTYIAKNQKDLERWMHKVGLTYDDFGTDIKAKGESWASFFQKAFHNHIIAGASQVTNDDMWAKITPKLANILLKGLGFNGLQAFQKFVNTGRMKTQERGGGKKSTGGHTTTPHSGGMIGHDKTMNRKGLRGIGGEGLHPSETWARVQHGEYIVNKKDAYANRPLLDRINAGHGGDKKVGYGGAKPVLPLVGYPAAMMAQGFMTGTEAASKLMMRYYKKHAGGPGGSSVAGGFVQGSGNRHRPVPAGIGLVRGIHDQYTGYPAVDIAAPMNTPAYAVANGVITRSEAITSGGSPGNGMYATPYRSYGNVMYLKTDGGPTVLYAHLNKRFAAAGTRVQGGARIGLTGNTGNSTGPHLHFGDSDGNPYEFLRKGGTVKFDNTPAMLHRGETVLTDKLTKQFQDNVAYGGGNVYDVNVNVHGSDLDPDDVADAVIDKLERRESRKPRSRRNRPNN